MALELSRHEFEQGLRDSEGQGSLTAAIHGPQRVIHDLATKVGLKSLELTGNPCPQLGSGLE